MREQRRRFVMHRVARALPPALLLLLPVAAAAANLASVTVNPAQVVGGSRVEVTITLDAPAPAGGADVALTISDPEVLNNQGTFTVAEGATSTGFTADPGAVATPAEVTLQASYAGVTRTATLTVTPRIPVRGVAGDLWADIVLGKPAFTEVVPNEVTSRRLFNPGGVLVDRTVSPNRLYVYDSGNNRVLGLNHLGSCTGGSNAGGDCTANSDCPGSTCAIEEGRGADLVLGQPSLNRAACNGDSATQGYPVPPAASAATLCSVHEGVLSPLETGFRASMAVDGAGNLYVPDFSNHRVLRYNSPFTSDTIADDVWGQADFTGRECNRGRGLGAPDNQSLCFASPYFGTSVGVGIDAAGNLWVADIANHRVLRFPFDPATGSPCHEADLVLGQPDFTSFTPGPGLHQMWSPSAVRVDGAGSVYVAEYSDGAPEGENNRVLIFDPPLLSGQTARKLDYPFYRPESLEFDPAGNLWVNDSHNTQLLLFVGGVVQRVLLKDLPASDRRCGSDNTTGDRPPFHFEGNGGTDFYSWNLCGVGGSIGVDSDGNVFLTATHSQDVWRFPVPFPTPTAGTAHSADARIFKPYQWAVPNEVGLAGIFGISGVAVAAGQLIVSDNRRLLFWNNPPNLTNGQSADGFVGEADPRSQAGAYFGRIREDGSSRLWAIRYDEIQVYSLPLTTGASPVATIVSPIPVLGGGSLTWDDLLTTGGIAPVGMGDKVWIADPTHNRVFRIRDPLSSPMVDIVLGQTSVSGTGCNQGRSESSPSRSSLCHPGSVVLDPQGNLYVSETALESAGNFRLLEYEADLFPESPASALFAIPASRVFGTGGSFTALACQHLELCTGFWEPTFDSFGQMVVGGNAYLTTRFPAIYNNPLANQRVSTYLNDYYSMGYAAAFDSSNNLYVGDLNWDRVLIYRDPLSSPGDLIVSALTVPATGGAGLAITVTDTTKNQGSGSAAPSTTSFYLSTDTTWDAGDVSFGSRSIPALAAAAVSTGSISLTIPAGTTTGTYYVIAKADAPGVIVETIETNNTRSSGTITIGPDLIVSALTVPATGRPGQALSVTDTTKNQTGTSPAPASTTNFYLSTDSNWDAADTYLGSRSIPPLAAGAVSTGSTSLTVPAGVTANTTYHVIAKADAGNSILETNETNNTFSSAIRTGVFFHTLTPCRVVDTRNANGPDGGPALAANSERVFTMIGKCGIPSTAQAVALNITVTGSTSAGQVNVYPTGVSRPNTTTVAYSTARTRANNALAGLGTGGAISVYCTQPAGTSVHLIVDVSAYFE